MLVTFERIEQKRSVTYTCTKCGKKKTKVVSYSETINPFNKDKDGNVKSRWEVEESVANGIKNAIDKFKSTSCCSKCRGF